MGRIEMTTAFWLGIAALSILLLICAWRLAVNRREALRLHDQIQRFLNGDIVSPAFSVRDDRFALFENAVVELETRILQSEENARTESEKNQAFVQDIAHQLKTPIAGLRLFCEMDDAEHKQQTLLLIERMESMIASLLRLEKLNADGYAFEFSMCDLFELAQDARAQFTALYPKKHIEIIGGADIRCDAYWMSEALNNLLKNACEHTSEDGRVIVTIERAESEAMIRVEDDGGGVPPESLSRIFERFHRSGKPEREQGVGLGLAIVKTIVQKHHGSVAAVNGKRGLAITIFLPNIHANLKKT